MTVEAVKMVVFCLKSNVHISVKYSCDDGGGGHEESVGGDNKKG